MAALVEARTDRELSWKRFCREGGKYYGTFHSSVKLEERYRTLRNLPCVYEDREEVVRKLVEGIVGDKPDTVQRLWERFMCAGVVRIVVNRWDVPRDDYHHAQITSGASDIYWTNVGDKYEARELVMRKTTIAVVSDYQDVVVVVWNNQATATLDVIYGTCLSKDS